MSESEEQPKFGDVRKYVPFLAKHEGLANLLEKALGYETIRRVFCDAQHDENPPRGVLNRLGISTHFMGAVSKIPTSGPLVVVANHSHGGADAMALMAFLSELRDDLKILANREVLLLEAAAPYAIPVSVLQTDQTAGNSAGLRVMLKHIKKGGTLGLFPAGRVSTWQQDRMRDLPWSEHMVKLIQRMDTTVVPLWFFGKPPAGIRLLSRVSTFVKAALIPTGFTMMRGEEVRGRFGEPFHSSKLREFGDEAGVWLRGRVESLADLGN